MVRVSARNAYSSAFSISTARPSVTSSIARSSPRAGRADHKALQGVASGKEGGRQKEDGQIRIETGFLIGKERRKKRGAQQCAVGEIDNVQHTIDQSEPERDQRVDRTGQKPVDDRRNQDRCGQHGVTTGDFESIRAPRCGVRMPRSSALFDGAFASAGARLPALRRMVLTHAGIGNTTLALANSGGRITLMSLSRTCVFTGAAPWFWPLTNLVGP